MDANRVIRGCTLMIIDDFDFFSGIIQPIKTDAVLIVDADAVLALPITLELLKTAPRQRGEVLQRLSRVKSRQLDPCFLMQFYRQRASRQPTLATVIDVFGSLRQERSDRHLPNTYTKCRYNGQAVCVIPTCGTEVLPWPDNGWLLGCKFLTPC